MIVYDPTVQERYAQALFNVARRRGSTEALQGEIGQLLPLFESGSKLRLFLEGPQITTEAKLQVIERVFKDKTDPLIYQLLLLLLNKGRIEYVRPILERFKVLVERDQGIFEVDVATAVELDADQKKQLQEALEKFTKARLRINFRVDPELIGGVWFKYGDTLIDDSIRGKLNRLRQQLEGAAEAQ